MLILKNNQKVKYSLEKLQAESRKRHAGIQSDLKKKSRASVLLTLRPKKEKKEKKKQKKESKWFAVPVDNEPDNQPANLPASDERNQPTQEDPKAKLDFDKIKKFAKMR